MKSPENMWDTAPLYPLGSRFIEHDDRFWVSRDEGGKAILFIRDTTTEEIVDVENIFSGLTLYQDHSFPGCRIVCKLAANDLETKYTYVCKDIISGASGLNGKELFSYLVQQLKCWSNFLKPTKEGLSDEEYLGLWGELSIIEDYYLPLFSPEELVNAWVGPGREPQDVVGNDFTLEIKATYSKTPKNLMISSLEQLDAEARFQAILLRRITRSSEGKSLKDMVSTIELYLNDDQDALVLFRKNINELYGMATEKQLNIKNQALQTRVWRIADDFPRLRRSVVPEGISKANYSLSIPLLSSFEIPGGIEEYLNSVRTS